VDSLQLQEEINNLRKTLDQQRAHSSKAIQEREESNKLLREQYERSQIDSIGAGLAAEVNLSDPNWNQPFMNLLGPERKESTPVATTPPIPNPGEIVMTQADLEKKMKQTAREAIKEYEAAKAAAAQKEADTYSALHHKFMTENPDMVPHAPYLNDVFTTLANAPKDPNQLYEYTMEAAKKSIAYGQQIAQQQAPQAPPRNPYSTAGLSNAGGAARIEPIQRYQGAPQQVPQNSVFDPRPEEMRLNDAAAMASERRKAYFKLGVSKS
jgi:hypothetical protein